MIQSFRNAMTASIFAGQPTQKFDPRLVERVRSKFALITGAVTIDDLRQPPSNPLERLRADRTGAWSVRVNDKWRICFIWTDDGPAEVELVDYYCGKGQMRTISDLDTVLPPLTPGRILELEFLEPLGLTATALAKACGIAGDHVDAVIAGHQRIDGDLALRLGRAFTQSPQFWLNIQAHYDLEMARLALGSGLQVVQVVIPAAE